MKRTLIHRVAIVIAIATIALSCKGPVEKVFDKEWENGEMSQQDKKTLEKYFNENGDTDPSEYWKLCFDEGGDTTNKKNPWAVAVTKPKDVRVKVYVDNSDSMKGYYQSPKSAPVIEVLSAIQTFFGERDRNIQGYYVDSKSKNNFTSYPLDELVSDLTMKKLRKYDDSYQLSDIIGKMISDIKSDSTARVVDFLITDGIPSGTNEEINSTKERDFNILSAAALQRRISDKFIGTKDIAVSVYQFKSGFKGLYWFYNNDHKDMSFDSRPFYVIALGERELVTELAEKEAAGLEYFKAEKKVHFGGVDVSKMSFAPTRVESYEFEDSEKINKTIEISLKGLPYFAKNEKFLKKNATLKIDGKEIDSEKWRVESDYIITYTLNIEEDMEYPIEIVVKNATPSWVEGCTCYDDKKLLKDRPLEFVNKTFNLKYLIEGLKNGVTGSKGLVTLYHGKFTLSTKDGEDD